MEDEFQAQLYVVYYNVCLTDTPVLILITANLKGGGGGDSCQGGEFPLFPLPRKSPADYFAVHLRVLPIAF